MKIIWILHCITLYYIVHHHLEWRFPVNISNIRSVINLLLVTSHNFNLFSSRPVSFWLQNYWNKYYWHCIRDVTDHHVTNLATDTSLDLQYKATGQLGTVNSLKISFKANKTNSTIKTYYNYYCEWRWLNSAFSHWSWWSSQWSRWTYRNSPSLGWWRTAPRTSF